MLEFLIQNWGELAIAFLALAKVIVNLTPTQQDNAVFAYVDMLINAVVKDRRK